MPKGSTQTPCARWIAWMKSGPVSSSHLGERLVWERDIVWAVRASTIAKSKVRFCMNLRSSLYPAGSWQTEPRPTVIGAIIISAAYLHRSTRIRIVTEKAPAKEFTLDSKRSGDVVLVHLHGKLVGDARDVLYAEVRKLIPGSKRIVLD